jgi:CDP-glycerol glycerophosphotransferase
MNSLLGQIKKMQLRDWKGLFLLAVSFVPGKIYKLFNRHVWIVSEYEHLARDNGYWFFKYVREKYPLQKAYFPLSEDSPDFEKINPLGNVIKFGSFFHYILFWGCEKYIGTTKCYGFPYRRICEDLVQWGLHGFKYVFLNHGVARGYSSIVDGRNTNYNLIFAISPYEKETIIREDYQEPDRIICAGFCRHDQLNDNILKNNRIVIMPTWRNYLDVRLLTNADERECIIREFLDSTYYKKWMSLINNPDFCAFVEEGQYEVIFYLHEYAQMYSKYFHAGNDKILIGTNDKYDIQKLLRSSRLLITDYSSVTYDFAYMYKPLIYYQFDLEEFESHQYSQGEKYTYETDGFGKVCYSEEETIGIIKDIASQDFRISEIYKRRVDDFFLYHDNNNCERAYKAIKKL